VHALRNCDIAWVIHTWISTVPVTRHDKRVGYSYMI
jgi:hypothetical protein